MRDVNKLERFIILLALYMWRWYEAMMDFVETVRENRRGLRRGAADIDWQRTLHALAAPVRHQRLTGEQPKVVLPDPDLSDMLRLALPATPAPSLAEQLAATGVEDIAPLNRTLPVVMETGAVVETIPTPAPHIRRHRVFDVVQVQAHTRRRPKVALKRALMASGAPEVRAREADVLSQLDAIVAEAMARLVDEQEAAAILELWSPHVR